MQFDVTKTLKMSKEMRDEIRRTAIEEDRSASAVIRRAINEYIERKACENGSARVLGKGEDIPRMLSEV